MLLMFGIMMGKDHLKLVKSKVRKSSVIIIINSCFVMIYL